MGAILEQLLKPLPDIRTMPSVEARLIIAFRLATRILIMAETIGFAWAEPFQIGRPCCSQTTPDEIWLVAALRLAAGNNRPAFDSLSCEMLGDSERERIFNDLRNFVAAYTGSGG